MAEQFDAAIQRCRQEQRSELSKYFGEYTNYPRARAYWHLGLSDWVMEEVLLIEENRKQKDFLRFRGAIRSKQEFYEGQKLRLFGNTLRIWYSPDELRESGYDGLVMLRSKDPDDKIGYRPDLTVKRALQLWNENHVGNECAPDEDILLQGEVSILSGEGLCLYYNTEPGYRMRVGLKRFGRHVYRSQAWALLKSVMDPPSFDDLCEMLDANEVIEFSAYKHVLGWAKRNVLFWECRSY